MQNIMGLFDWYKRYSKVINRVFLLLLIIGDAYLAGLIYGPEIFKTSAKAFEKKMIAVTAMVAKPSASASPSVTSKPSPSPKASAFASPTTSPTPTPTASSNAESTTPTPSATATPTPTSTPTATPTPTPTPTATPTPTPTPSPVTSPVYIKAYFYENNNQYVAQQNPVKVINSQTNETLFTGETDHEGNSPIWKIAANTPITVYLYPKPGMLGCGDSWSLTIGTLGTMEAHNLSIQGDRTPCIKQ